MTKKLVLAALVAGAVNLTPIAPAHASPGEGRDCDLQSAVDPTVENGGTHWGTLSGGPFAATTPGSTVTLTCTVQVGAVNSTHAGSDSTSLSSTSTQAAAVSGQVSYVLPEDQPQYVCTEVRVDGTTWYRDAVAETWSTDSGVPCRETASLSGGTWPIEADLLGTIYIRSDGASVQTWQTGALDHPNFFECRRFGPTGGPIPSFQVRVTCTAYSPTVSGVSWRCNHMTPGAMVFPDLVDGDDPTLPWLATLFELLEGNMAVSGPGDIRRPIEIQHDPIGPPPTVDFSPRTRLTTVASCDDSWIETSGPPVTSVPVDIDPVTEVSCVAKPELARPPAPLGPYLAACNFS